MVPLHLVWMFLKLVKGKGSGRGTVVASGVEMGKEKGNG